MKKLPNSLLKFYQIATPSKFLYRILLTIIHFLNKWSACGWILQNSAGSYLVRAILLENPTQRLLYTKLFIVRQAPGLFSNRVLQNFNSASSVWNNRTLISYIKQDRAEFLSSTRFCDIKLTL